ncbi:MAG TPA: transcription termination/antitermination protein NusG [Candidatus Hydrogenedens sp.]|nr:transcription termination/antitermination protein NusG [Candidatus Hydrogenedens sp.]HOK09124.1 transcription termination/antitermination protein NusG [Candidatus Hydrogenedens sp.]HOL20386.1 transcription termination/antitermination protein NusG [Candidatus Hydrogenedens sp.]HPP58891.1 transcription termination/antitermination protein NusG [Candidatus Hydrogenedens sp.]
MTERDKKETTIKKEGAESSDVGTVPTREKLLRPVPEDGIPRRWYALHVLTAKEYEVCDKLIKGAKQRGIEDLVVNVLVPKERVTERRGGTPKVVEHKCFPGYVLVQLPEHPEKYEDVWSLIRETPGITGFVSSRRNVPTPIPDEEVEGIIAIMTGEEEAPKPKLEFSVGDRVKIVEGPFANFVGKIEEINAERGALKISVEIFNRVTTIEVETWQVETF